MHILALPALVVRLLGAGDCLVGGTLASPIADDARTVYAGAKVLYHQSILLFSGHHFSDWSCRTCMASLLSASSA
ncbi:hypothetical protein Pint_34587 [Pistacia integerrima]|uniref:Uncharacterized protein n=1 Tax=Pistacia integerrima TaxID=434235 RepID=A0ACC0X752_9ROSI|nr:hypothetical protein Pint_34587 [Pistacia integerrima]